MTDTPISGNGTLVAGLGGPAGFGETTISRNDDGSQLIADVSSVFENGINFFGTTYTGLYVNTNGSISFGSSIGTYTPSTINGGGIPMIAPFWADVDTRTPANIGAESAPIYFDLDPVSDVLTVTWSGVNYYAFHGDHQNYFQLQLYDRGLGDFDIVFRYQDIQWVTGDASDGAGGFGGTPARAGFTAGDFSTNWYELTASGNQSALLNLDTAIGDTGVSGLWVFNVRNGETLIPTSVIFGESGKLGFLAELARAAYHLRVDATPGDDIDSNETASFFFPVDPAVDPSFGVADHYLHLMNASDFGAAGAALQLDEGLFETDGLENGIFTSGNAAALVGRSQDALFISFRGTNDSLDAAQDLAGAFDAHWLEFGALRAAVTSYINDSANGISHIYVTGHSLGAAMAQAMMIEHAGDSRFEAATFGSPGYLLGFNQDDGRIANFANDGDLVSFVQVINRIDGDRNVFVDGITGLTVGLTEHSMNLYYAEAQFLRANGIDIGETEGASTPIDYDHFVFAAHDIGGNAFTIGNLDETLFGTSDADWMLGSAGSDTLIGNDDPFAQDHDIMNGGDGDDIILGEFTDTIIGGAGTDLLYAVNANPWTIDLAATSIEWMSAGFGDDTITAAGQSVGVTIYAGGGNDIITGSSLADTIWAGVGNDTVDGSGGDDVIIGDLGADSLSGGGGSDTIYIDGDDTLFDGGDGTDALYITAGIGRTIDMALTHFEWISDFAGANDVIDGSGMTVIEVAYGGAGGDVITGGTGDDFLWGEGGNDTITGGIGNDTLVGGIGADTLTGGVGTDTIFANSGGGGDGAVDTIVFNAPGWGTDFIYDFEHGIDKLNLHGSGATAGTITITNVAGHAHVHFGADLIVVVGAGATLDSSDFVF